MYSSNEWKVYHYKKSLQIKTNVQFKFMKSAFEENIEGHGMDKAVSA